MGFELQRILQDMVNRGASDLHLRAKAEVYLRNNGAIERTSHASPMQKDLEDLCKKLLRPEEREVLARNHHVHAVFQLPGMGARFRTAIYRQRGTLALAIRQIPASVPSLDAIGLRDRLGDVVNRRRGLILVTGPAASGKTTTMLSLIQYWNENLRAHIVTLEDPVEYVFAPRKSLVNQRQIGLDTPSYAVGLRQVLRQNPDIICLGDMLDLETVSVALAAADTGHLVVATLQTPGVATSVEHLVGLFPASMQGPARGQLAIVLQCIVSQVLVPVRDMSRRIAAFEILNVAEAHRNLIRTSQSFRLTDSLDTSPGCTTLQRSLAVLAGQGVIRDEEVDRFRIK